MDEQVVGCRANKTRRALETEFLDLSAKYG